MAGYPACSSLGCAGKAVVDSYSPAAPRWADAGSARIAGTGLFARSFSSGAAPIWERIKVDPSVCNGRPTIRGVRITVDLVLRLISGAYSAEDMVRLHPELEIEDVHEAARHAAWLAKERTTALS